MTKYGVFLTILFTFLISFIIGAKTFQPTNLIEYKVIYPEIERCQEKGGSYKIQDGYISCTISQTIYNIPLNVSVFDKAMERMEGK